MNITKKQQTWMAAVLAAGLLGSGAVLWTGRAAAPAPGEHAHEAGEAHADEHSDKTTGKDADSGPAHADEAALIRLTAAQQAGEVSAVRWVLDTAYGAPGDGAIYSASPGSPPPTEPAP